MKIIYALAIEEAGLSPAERESMSSLVGRLETQAHQWMMRHHPDVLFRTQRIAPTVSRQFDCRLVDCRRHDHVESDSATEQERGRQILVDLHEYLRQEWQAWWAEKIMEGAP